ncbi:MAG: peptidoglycan-binding protein [Verrucomicrobiota bacterium]|nr:peptidoglycan-binding protein [Verrucomicrobiota bacterium]
MKTFRWLLLLPAVSVLLGRGTLMAQDDVRSVQEELRRRSLYFGDVNGRESAELQEATKRYQKKKGFSPTGKPDRETLKSLGLVARSPDEAPPPEVTWPDEPVLRSDEKIDPVAVAATLNEETGIAPAAVVPKKLAEKARATSKRRKARNTNATDAAPAAAAAAAAAAAPVASGQKLKNSPVITPVELARFASDYFAAMGSNDLKRQLKFYADSVKYYENGSIDRRIIEQTLLRYQARWPNRHYTMGREIRYGEINSKGEIVMTFPIAFTLKDGRRTVKGQTENRLAISAATVDPRITSISEKRVRR